MKNLKTHRSFGGKTQFWSHASSVTQTEMKFATFIPEGQVKGCLIWLSGLTCTEENFITKAGAQQYLAEHQLMVLAPDTSPRGLDLPGEHESYDFGSGAGFYVNATVAPYATNYRMFDYVVSELYELAKAQFQVSAFSIFGHSMGGHGALVMGLRHPEKFKSVSAFSPIAHPSVAPWGEKAFRGYLGHDRATWKNYDATELLLAGQRHPAPILIHQGTADEFLEQQLRTADIEAAAQAAGQSLAVKMCEGYDHSYYFMASFMREHVAHHAQHLR